MSLEPIAYSARQTAEVTGLSVNRVRELASKGQIPSVRIGGLWRFPVARLHAWLEQDGQVASVSSGHGRPA